ncbi:MAG: hypothetical protein QOG16_250, partial [Actinomycetota bacterium]|nr:hypothetical protein [Actinomycetota bacterium]
RSGDPSIHCDRRHRIRIDDLNGRLPVNRSIDRPRLVSDSPTVLQQLTIPDAISALDVLPSDYIDLFVATTPQATDASPELWARVALEEASAAGRFVAWRLLLGLRLESEPSQDHVAGWKIAERGEDWIRIEASSWFMTANIVFTVAENEVSFTTLIRYDRAIAKAIWTPISAIHRQLAPGVLYAAVRRINRRR